MFIFCKQIDILRHNCNQNRQYYTLTANQLLFQATDFNNFNKILSYLI